MNLNHMPTLQRNGNNIVKISNVRQNGGVYFVSLYVPTTSNNAIARCILYGNGVELFKTGGQTSRYTKLYRGDVTAVTTGDTKTEYFYDAFGNKQTDTDTSTNPFEYCGEYFDDETGLIYLRNRYYDPTNGRFVTEDPARDGENWYVYCENNPVIKTDYNGLTSKKEARKIISDNAQYIIDAGNYYGVNPAIIAACIYTEQTENVNFIDTITDVPGYIFDTSIGVGQVKVSTALLVEEAGYIQKTSLSYSYEEWHANSYVMRDVWYAPCYGEVQETREKAIAYRLTVDGENINYVAAYLKYFQDRWHNEYPNIDGDTAILATLFNQGEKYSPHSDPKPNIFGKKAKKVYYDMKKLLNLD